jgi:RNAse (barnase) inhibitor barstar
MTTESLSQKQERSAKICEHFYQKICKEIVEKKDLVPTLNSLWENSGEDIIPLLEAISYFVHKSFERPELRSFVSQENPLSETICSENFFLPFQIAIKESNLKNLFDKNVNYPKIFQIVVSILNSMNRVPTLESFVAISLDMMIEFTLVEMFDYYTENDFFKDFEHIVDTKEQFGALDEILYEKALRDFPEEPSTKVKCGNEEVDDPMDCD